MKKFTFSFLLLVWICNSIQMFAQKKMIQVREDGVYLYVDQMPVYSQGGQEGIMKYLTETVKYPTEAQEKGISGNVLVQFVVKKNGKISDFKVVRGVEPSLDEEALRAVKGIPGKWIPGREKGKKVPVSYTIPVSFRLTGKSQSASSSNSVTVNKNIKASLEGIWQICTRVKPLGYGKFDIQTGPYLKIFSSDKNFFNMHLSTMNGRSVITAMGTYEQTSDNTYVEKIFKSVTEPELTGADSKLEFGFISENLLEVSFRLPGRPVNSREIWVRVIQPNLKQPEILLQTF
ncbi:TonB family protein [Bacteroides sp. AN502(2024)]|uniref:TonB family protein n=1 Tax=Bacteroides sp. AN502(2024) TaxID=3160599 RepID=UPI003512B719